MLSHKHIGTTRRTTARANMARRNESSGTIHTAMIGRFCKLLLVLTGLATVVAGIVALKSAIWVAPFLR
jgi:hypothetical protein